MLLIGCDPEVFVRNPNHQGFISGHGLIPGTKFEPYKVEKGAVQVDGMALEFNTDPAETEDIFVSNIGTVVSNLKRMVTGYDLVFQPVAEFGKEYIDAQPDEAKDLGCNPDYNAWLLGVNDVPDRDTPFRTASGHVHLGWGKDIDVYDMDNFMECARVVRQLDFYLGLPSLTYDKDNRRRDLYGRAGAFRPKPYGVEYRVLSNVWVNSEELTRWVFRNTQVAYEELMKGNDLCQLYGDIQEIINESNVDEAVKLCKEIGINVPNS